MSIDRSARILNALSWGDYHLLAVESGAVGRDGRPGQFVMVKVANSHVPLLRRPLSLHDSGPAGIELFFKVAGQGTEILARKRPGDAVDIIGPLGKGFSVSAEFSGKKTFLVGGGRGIAPLYFLARELRAVGALVTVFYGGRTILDLPLRGKFEAAGFSVRCTTDDGSCGFRGLVSDSLGRELEGERADFLFACGPDAMMRTIARTARSMDIPAEFSLEAIMGCGIGACWGCVQRIRNGNGDGWVKICEEGPVFRGDRIVWMD
jgi:dihydroorotate dehydrogenase electron transfer subunit